MVRTPWGDSHRLAARRLRPGPGIPREEAEANQRERLMAAVVAAVEERGYGATTVADLVRLSGVSRSAFYRQFADKEACFVAAVEEILRRAMGLVALRYDGRGSALRTFIGLIVEQPAAARFCFVESYAAGSAAVAAMDRAVGGVEGLYERAFAAREGEAEMPVEIVAAIVGGLRKVIYTRLRHGQEAELRRLTGALWEWSFSYEPPPRLPRSPRVRTGTPGLYRPGDPAERIIAAAAEGVAEKGYAATTIGEIVGRAGASLSTFYEHFDGKEDVMAAALDAGEGRLFGQLLPAYRRAGTWPAAVRETIETMLAFLAAEPAFARLATVEVQAAGAAALERREGMIERMESFLDPGLERSPQLDPVVREAIGGAIYALISAQLRNRGPESLPALAPTATYIALAPFLGAAEACEVTNGRQPARAG